MKQQLKCGKSLKNIDAKFAISVPRDNTIGPDAALSPAGEIEPQMR
jgi:hypothetical protein